MQPPSPQEPDYAKSSCRQQHDLPRGCTGCMASLALQRDDAKAVSMQHTSSGGLQKERVSSLFVGLLQRSSSQAGGQASCPCGAGEVPPLCSTQTSMLCVSAAECTGCCPRKRAVSVPRHQQLLVSLAIHSDWCHAQHLLPLCKLLAEPEHWCALMITNQLGLHRV